MAKPKITLFVDIASPFCYMVFHILQRSPVFELCDITYIPISLAELMKLCGNTPPLQIKNKSDWLIKEHFRWAKLLQVPISPKLPSRLPLNTTSTQRVLTAISLLYPGSLPSAISLLYLNFWNHHVDPTEPEQLRSIVTAVLGSEQEADRAIELSEGNNIGTELSQATLAAFKEGAFGLPWLVVISPEGAKENFWGVQSMGQVCDHLGLLRPGEGGWKALL
ncbi:thioredoxin-like protein [Phaeosphaeriaceae sp. PMI808]|nr:thioredoxin-like protein [Phaeosphaeriaceae sp. PMI808]